jgi:hypothetical protein
MDTEYSMDLNCGECIAAGHNFLWRSEENGLVVNDEEYPSNTGKYEDTDIMCCEGSFDFYNKDWDYTQSSPTVECAKLFKRANNRDKKLWRQSDTYSSTSYAMSMCPFRRSSCGPLSKINFYTSKDDGAIHVIGLNKGESCTYNIESVCGAPSFKIDNAKGVEIIYNEWQ